MVKDNILYQLHQGIPESGLLNEVNDLYVKLFSDADPDFFIKRVRAHPDLMLVTARVQNALIGFKLGYPILNDTFYSWIGGVHPYNRKQGVAFQLAELQENWAKKHGFKFLKTKSMNRFKPMMMLNLKRGFDITKVYTNEKGQTKVVFYKAIDQNNSS